MINSQVNTIQESMTDCNGGVEKGDKHGDTIFSLVQYSMITRSKRFEISKVMVLISITHQYAVFDQVVCGLLPYSLILNSLCNRVSSSSNA